MCGCTSIMGLIINVLILEQGIPQGNNNNNFIHTLESKVVLYSVVFNTGSNAIQRMNKYSNTTSREIKMPISIHS